MLTSARSKHSDWLENELDIQNALKELIFSLTDQAQFVCNY